jgi:tRNA pseudouridine32 synthase / 23S rRNA pseudouridine746 synthase
MEKRKKVKQQYKHKVGPQDLKNLLEFLVKKTPVSEKLIIAVIQAGGCWIRREGKGKEVARRIKDLNYVTMPGDRVELYIDENALVPPQEKPFILLNQKYWSIWYKPVNVLAQGSLAGNIFTMETLAQRENDRVNKKTLDTVHIVNRLDKEASGIMLVAYSKKAASILSNLLADKETKKIYQLELKGMLKDSTKIIELALDGKKTKTQYMVVDHTENKTTLVEARLITGRKHQLRRHFDLLGHPVMGDPLYGRGNKDNRGLRLVSADLHFICPFSGKNKHIEVPKEKRLW